MDIEVLIALISKHVEEKLSELPPASHGPRGHRGPPGAPGKDFVFSEYEEQIKSWVKDFSLKFEDLTDDQINSLRGPMGIDGADGADFNFESSKEEIDALIRNYVSTLDLKLKFEDLDHTEIESLRGPGGRDGKDGKSFVFEEHEEYFKSLKLKFSDLSKEEIESLTLTFSKLTEEEKDSLKLKFSDLSDDERRSLRGSRGARGQRGLSGKDGTKWVTGKGPPESGPHSPGDLYLDEITGDLYQWE